MTTLLTVRLYEAAEQALEQLTADGSTKTEVTRQALVAAAREARRAELRAWAEKVRNDPEELAANRRMSEFMDSISAG